MIEGEQTAPATGVVSSFRADGRGRSPGTVPRSAIPVDDGGADRRRSAPTRVALALGGGIGLWVVTFSTAVQLPAVRSDEAWFLWVAVRANSGAALYRGVYFVSTPLAMWVMQAAVWLFGAQVQVERALVSACFATSLVLLWTVGGRLGIRRIARVLLLALVFLYGSPVAHFGSVYSVMAVTFALAALLVLLDATARLERGFEAPIWWAGAGVLCGLAFDTKPNVGLFALVALLGVIAVTGRLSTTNPIRPIVLAIAGFCAAVAMMMLAVVLSHSTTQFVGDVFTGKDGTYLAVEGHQVLPGLGRSFDLFRGVGSPLGQLVLRTSLLVPCASVVLVGLTAWRAWHRRSPGVLAVCAFALVGLGAAAPDLGPQHLTEAMPLLLGLPILAFASAGFAPRRALSRTGRTMATAATATVLMVAIVSVVVWTHRAELPGHDHAVAARIPHFDGAVVSARSEASIRADIVELRRDTRGTVFLGVLNAGFYYLAADLRDPTRYDYPGRSDFGAGGEAAAIRALRRRQVAWVCIPGDPKRRLHTSRLEPLRLETYVRHTLTLVEHLHMCDLYRNPQQRPGGPAMPVVRRRSST